MKRPVLNCADVDVVLNQCIRNIKGDGDTELIEGISKPGASSFDVCLFGCEIV